jgi:hypothetical protein
VNKAKAVKPTYTKPNGDPWISLSLGAGVQSSTTALLAEQGKLGYAVDFAIFSDTVAEPRQVYEWLDWLEARVSYPIYRVSAGNLLEAVTTAAVTRFARPPFFTLSKKGKVGMSRRQCTRDYKIRPIERKVREIIGLEPRQRGPKKPVVLQLIGISTDEASRMKPNDKRYIENRWPLIELGMSRQDCIEWVQKNYGRTPPKSACTFCPFHDNALWRDLQVNDPESFAQAVYVDQQIRIVNTKGLRGEMYLHRDCKPLDQIDFRSAEEAGQEVLFPNQFNNECTGMCGQ